MQADVVAAEGDRPGFNAVDWSIVSRGIFHYTRFGQYSASRNTICRDIAPIGLLLSSGMIGGPKMGCVIFRHTEAFESSKSAEGLNEQ